MAALPVTDPAAGALPVALQLTGPHAGAVRRWVEGTLGWQPVDGATASLVPPAVVLRDLESRDAPVAGGTPCVLLIPDDAAPDAAARAATAIVPAAVIGWPSGRDALARVVGEVVARPRGAPSSTRRLVVGGSAGGVGTTTVTLGLAGLAAWSGARTLALLRGYGLRARPVPAASVAGPDLFARADPVPGCPDLRAVSLSDRDPVPDPGDGTLEVLVVDAGVDPDVDVLVCRPDAAALAMLPHTTAAAVALVGEGPARDADLARAAGSRRGVRLPWSVRVARAGLAGRIPAGLPGAWVRRLTPLLPEWSPPGTDRSNLDDPSRFDADPIPTDAARPRPSSTAQRNPRRRRRRSRVGS